MKRIIILLLKIAGFALSGFLVFWVFMALYINSHKKEVLASISNQLKESINGTFIVGSMEPSLIRDFPAISVSLENVLLYDTMYYQHHHKLLEAKSIMVSLYPFSIFGHTPRISNIHISEGNVYLFTDSAGYSNTNIFLKKIVKDTTKKSARPQINHVFFSEVHFVYEHKADKKLFDFKVHRMEGEVLYEGKDWAASLKVDMLVNAMDFYNPNGPFLKGKHVLAELKANYRADSQIVSVPLKTIYIESNAISIGAKIFLAQQPATYQIAIEAKGLLYQQGRSMLSAHIQEKTAMIDLERPLDIQVYVSGKNQKRDEPVVNAHWQVKENTLSGQGTQITKCSFTGYFFNQVDAALPVGDRNSVIAVDHFSGNWEGIDFNADSVRVNDLISPILAGHFRSSFELEKLNPVLSNKSFLMKEGQIVLDLSFRGGIKNNDTTEPFITGSALLKNASISYVPRHLDFTNTQAELYFTGQDLLIKNILLQNGSNVLNMDASIKDLLHYYYTNPEKVLLSWRIRSKQINLNQYSSFLGLRNNDLTTNGTAETKRPKSVRRFSTQLDHILEQSSVHIVMNVAELSYQKFKATNIAAAVNITQSAIELQRVSLQHSEGKTLISGRIGQSGSQSPFSLNANIEHVRIGDFLNAFDNFGQVTLTDKNIEGTISLQTAVSGKLQNNGSLVPYSMKGNVAFELQNSALLNFGPLKNIGNYLFRQRDFSHINIRELKGSMEIDSDRLHLDPIRFSSNAINADLEGIYAFGKGTDINMSIPLRNPKNDGLLPEELQSDKKRNSGIVLHLNISDKENGKMKIRLAGRRGTESK